MLKTYRSPLPKLKESLYMSMSCMHGHSSTLHINQKELNDSDDSFSSICDEDSSPIIKRPNVKDSVDPSYSPKPFRKFTIGA